jgi:glucose/arabinose dehydrogenase
VIGAAPRRGAAAIVAAVVLVATGCTPPPTPTAGAPDYTVSTVISGLDHPWDVAFLPDGTMLVTERAGRIDAVVGGVRRILASPPDAVSTSEGGMLGLAVDPAFATNRRIYTCFESNASGALDERVARWTVSADLTSLSSRTDIVTGIPLNNAGNPGRHSGCRPRFGPDGALWITTGDGVRVDTAQNPASLSGKILRVDTNGTPAAGNPGGALDPRIFTLGHRNVQGLSFRPGDGKAFSIEQGTNCDDEVNLPAAGANFGWNPGAAGFYNEVAPMTDTATVPSAVAAVWSSGCPTIATSGGTFISGSQWGAWNGSLAMGALAGTQVRVVQFTSGAAPTFVQQWTTLTDRGRIRSLTQGPDGDLYVPIDASPGSILRLTPR